MQNPLDNDGSGRDRQSNLRHIEANTRREDVRMIVVDSLTSTRASFAGASGAKT